MHTDSLPLPCGVWWNPLRDLIFLRWFRLALLLWAAYFFIPLVVTLPLDDHRGGTHVRDM